MKPSILITTLFSLVATAFPSTPLIDPIEIRAPAAHNTLPVYPTKFLEVRASPLLEISNQGDKRAATIYKRANLAGDSTFIPANSYCTNISNIFGGFDGQVRSLSVEEGVKCAFYQEPDCSVNDFTGGGKVLEVGFRDRRDVRRKLGSWEGRIQSVFCQRLERPVG